MGDSGFLGRVTLSIVGWPLLVLAMQTQGTSRNVAASALLDAYDHGHYADAVHLIDQTADLDNLDNDLSAQAGRWIQDHSGSPGWRKSLVAGAVALEITHALVVRESWTAEHRGSHIRDPVALMTVSRVISEQPHEIPSAIYRDWSLATISSWQEWDAVVRGQADPRMTPGPAWAVLLGRADLIEHLKVSARVGSHGFLEQVLSRLPDDPRVLLALVEGHEAVETRCAPAYCHDEMTTSVLADLKSRVKNQPPDDRTVGCSPYCWSNSQLRDIHDSAVANLAAFDRLLPIASEFARLAAAQPSVRAEASVHIGYLAIRSAHPDAALQPLAEAATSKDPYVHYLAEHFTGRALEMLGRRSEAIAAYRRALSDVPGALSTSTLLAAALFVNDDNAERVEAHALLEAAISAPSRPIDPWDLYWQGDARFRTMYIDRLLKDLIP